VLELRRPRRPRHLRALRPRLRRLRRDIHHVARSRRKGYRFRNCEKVELRPEIVRGGPMKSLS